jgi:hypothetical protein
MRTVIDILTAGRNACLAQQSELPVELADKEIEAALHAADLLYQEASALPSKIAAKLYYYDRAIERARSEATTAETQLK